MLKSEYLIKPKGTKFLVLGELGLTTKKQTKTKTRKKKTENKQTTKIKQQKQKTNKQTNKQNPTH